MASTEQIRRWYPDVVTNHAQRGTADYKPTCDTSKAIRVEFPREGGGVWRLLVHPAQKEAWEVYAELMVRFGETVPVAGGTHNCRNIGSGDWPSLHAYCSAIDIPPNGRKSAAFQAAVLKIRTRSGATVFRNLASINDRMHDQIDCSPADLASGIDRATVNGGDDNAMSYVPTPENGPPRTWAEKQWDAYATETGTDPDTRHWLFFREDLSWFYFRTIKPIMSAVQKLLSRMSGVENRATKLEQDLARERKDRAAEVAALMDTIRDLSDRLVAVENGPGGSAPSDAIRPGEAVKLSRV